MDAEAKGILNDNGSSFHDSEHNYHTSVPGGLWRFWLAVGVLFFAIVGAIALSGLSTIKSACMFPPYLDEKDLRTQNKSTPYGRADVLPASMEANTSLPDMGDGIGQVDGKKGNWQGYNPPTGMLPAPH
jgi:hypothetical protein